MAPARPSSPLFRGSSHVIGSLAKRIQGSYATMRCPRCGTRRCTMRQQSGIAPLFTVVLFPLTVCPPFSLFCLLFLFSHSESPWNTLLNGTNQGVVDKNDSMSIFLDSQRETMISRGNAGIKDYRRRRAEPWMDG